MLYEEIGQKIRKRRQDLKLTQQQVADRAGISMSFYGHIERGTRKLSVDTFYKVVQALNCSSDELLGFQQESPDLEAAALLLKQALQMTQK